MSDTIGGGLKVSGVISRAERLLRSDKLSKEVYDETTAFLRGLLTNPIASVGEKIKVADVLLKCALAGDKLASEMATEERIDKGGATSVQKVTVRLRFDKRG